MAFSTKEYGASGASELSDLSDVGSTTPTNRNVLVADGDSWESRALTEADISDLGTYQTQDDYLDDIAAISNPAADVILFIDNTDDTVKSLTIGTGLTITGTEITASSSAPAIDDITDVTITTPADNEVLAFDNGTGEWINQTPTEAGLATAAQGALADSALQDVVDDTTPQLGGDLDGQSTYDLNNIVNADFEGYIDLAEVAEPSGVANTARLFAFDQNGQTRLKFIDSNDVVTDIAQDNTFVVRNTTGSAMSKGDVVYVSAQTGAVPEVALAKSDSSTTMPAVAVLNEAISDNGYGTAIKVGIIESIDTSAFNVNDELFVSATTAGELTATRPPHPHTNQAIGRVLVSGVGNGSVQVNIEALMGDELGTQQNTYGIGDGTAGTKTIAFKNGSTGSLSWTPSAARTLTLPDATDTLIGRDTTDTLTNKTIDADSNTISNIALGAEATGALGDLSNVTESTPGDNEVLQYVTDHWENQTLAEAGIQAQGDVLDDLNTLGAATADSQFIVATGAGAFAYESGATARTSLGLGTGDSPQFSTIELGAATDTTLARVSAGVVSIEGVTIATASNTLALTNKTFDANGTGNSLSNVEVADLATAAKTGSDTKVVTGTAGTDGNTATWNSDGDLVDGPPPTSSVQFVIDGGGSAITTGVKGYLEVPFACTIEQVTMLADQSTSTVVDVWKDTYANFPPTDADSITASAVPTITTAQKSQDGTLTGWTTSVSAGDILGFNVDSNDNATRVTIALKVKRT